MLEDTYSDEQKFDLFLDWLSCNQDSLTELCFDSDFLNGFRMKCFSEARKELINRSRYEGLQRNKKEIKGLIDNFLYFEVFYGMKERHIKENYEFENIKRIYALIHDWIGFGKFRSFFRKYYLELNDDVNIQSLEKIELYNNKLEQELSLKETREEIKIFLEKIFEEFEKYLQRRKKKNSFDLVEFSYAVYEAIEKVGLNIKYEKEPENMAFETEDLSLALYLFLDQPVKANQDEIKKFIEGDQSSYNNNYEHSLKKIRSSWKKFEENTAEFEKFDKDYQETLQKLRRFVAIKYFYKKSDEQES